MVQHLCFEETPEPESTEGEILGLGEELRRDFDEGQYVHWISTLWWNDVCGHRVAATSTGPREQAEKKHTILYL